MIIFAEKEYHVFQFRTALYKPRRVLVAVIVGLHLLIQGKHPRDLCEILIYFLTYQLLLSPQHIPQKIDIVLKGRLFPKDGGIPLSTHPHGYHVLQMSVPLKPVPPEPCDTLFIAAEIPGISVDGILSADMRIFFAVS